MTALDLTDSGGTQHVRTRRTAGAVLLALALVLAGCSGGGNPLEDGTTPQDGDGASTDWCRTGSSYSFANPQNGEQTSMEIQGIVEKDGRDVCKATWTTTEGDVQRMELFFTEDSSYSSVVMYDGDGNVVSRYSGSDPTSGDGATDVVSDGTDGASASFCDAGQSQQFVDPQTGEQVALEVEGVVTHDGREVCKAVYSTNQGDIQRIEMYYTEDDSYQKVVLYDGDGNVVGEYGGATGS